MAPASLVVSVLFLQFRLSRARAGAAMSQRHFAVALNSRLCFDSSLKGGAVIPLSSVSVDASVPGFKGEFSN